MSAGQKWGSKGSNWNCNDLNYSDALSTIVVANLVGLNALMLN